MRWPAFSSVSLLFVRHIVALQQLAVIAAATSRAPNPATYPSLDSVIRLGESTSIQWNPSTSRPVSLRLLGGYRSYTIVSQTDNDGWYPWTPSLELSSGLYHIEICDIELGECSSDDNPTFELTSQASSSYRSSADSTSPAPVTSPAALPSSSSIPVPTTSWAWGHPHSHWSYPSPRPSSSSCACYPSTLNSSTPNPYYNATRCSCGGPGPGDYPSDGLSGGAIAGIVIGVLGGIALAALTCFCCIRGNRESRTGPSSAQVVSPAAPPNTNRAPPEYSELPRRSTLRAAPSVAAPEFIVGV